jgi:N-acetylmuramoyl-L-alanine amidase
VINRIISGLIFICLVSQPVGVSMADESIEAPLINQDVINVVVEDKPEVHEELVDNTVKLTNDEIDLISRVVMAEAEDEPFEGKIYVVDTILNRVDSKHFPNNVHDVIYQQSQFTSMWNGRYNRCQSNKDLNKMIINEYKNRSDSDIVFFTADHYGAYGRPSFRVGNHYFATYK